MKNNRPLILLLAFYSQLFCCYEGWDYEKTTGQGQNVKKPQTPQQVDKKYAYTMIEEIYLSDDALASSDCVAEPGLADYRSNETSTRMAAVTTALNSMSEHLEKRTHSIPASDCQTLATILLASIDDTEWPNLLDSDQSKPVLHLRFIVWNSDVAQDPPSSVSAINWTYDDSLIDRGIDLISVNYFVLSNLAQGYFESWYNATMEKSFLSQGIDVPDLSSSGIDSRNGTITSDTGQFLSWLESN